MSEDTPLNQDPKNHSTLLLSRHVMENSDHKDQNRTKAKKKRHESDRLHCLLLVVDKCS